MEIERKRAYKQIEELKAKERYGCFTTADKLNQVLMYIRLVEDSLDKYRRGMERELSECLKCVVSRFFYWVLT